MYIEACSEITLLVPKCYFDKDSMVKRHMDTHVYVDLNEACIVILKSNFKHRQILTILTISTMAELMWDRSGRTGRHGVKSWRDVVDNPLTLNPGVLTSIPSSSSLSDGTLSHCLASWEVLNQNHCRWAFRCSQI